MTRITQAVFFFGVAEKRGFHKDRGNTLSFQNGKVGVFDRRLVQGPELGELAEHFVSELNAVAQLGFGKHVDDRAARLLGHVLKDGAADFVGAVLGLGKPAGLQGRCPAHA